MKRILGLCAVLLFVPGLAFAGWNIQQSDDGTAAWTNGTHDIPVGRDLTINLTDVSTASTVFVVVPITGTISQIWSVLSGAIATHDITLTVGVAAKDSTTFTDYSDPITVATSGSAAGTMDTRVFSGLTVEGGGVIAIRTSGYSTNTVSAEITIRVEGQ